MLRSIGANKHQTNTKRTSSKHQAGISWACQVIREAFLLSPFFVRSSSKPQTGECATPRWLSPSSPTCTPFWATTATQPEPSLPRPGTSSSQLPL